MDDKDHAVLAYSSNRPNEKNEDRQSDDSFLLNGAPVRVLGVYDGHGGPWTPEYVSHVLPAVIQQHIENAAAASPSIPGILISSFKQVDRNIVEPVEAKFAPVLPSTPYNLTFARRRNDIAKKKRDTRTQDLEVIPLSMDQDGNNPAEYARVRHEHAKDTNDPFTGGRLFGMMPLTRSFGDSFYKYQSTDIAQYVFGNAKLNKEGHLSYHEAMSPYYPLLETPPYLTATPEVISHRRSPEDVFMIMASDGVWAIKGMTNEWVVAKAIEALSNTSVEDPSMSWRR
ncbi:hypothetical protein PG996_005706 [Apiospora saccharicola]|uniref:PPM-type phosphatase domain-containing protein n=1 Tax=Apiospora saccharicola TaxID=335842 RepID=A0ABR1VM78_9PEZI